MQARNTALALALVFVAVGVLAASTRDIQLVDAAKHRNLQAVRSLLRQHVDVNARQGDGATALAWAAHWDDVAMAGALIRAGADVNAANDLGVTPLMLACTNGSAAMVGLLLQARADPDASLPSGETALFAAARTGNLEVVQQLLARNANSNAQLAETGQTPLMWALASGHADIAAALIAAGANIHARSVGGVTPLLFAAQRGDVKGASALLAAGADLEERPSDGSTALHIAAAQGHAGFVEFLLARGVPADATGPGYTALLAATFRGDIDLVKTLLAHGANSNARLERVPPAVFGYFDFTLLLPPAGATPLWLAAKPVNLELIRMLIAAGADRTQPADDGTTPFMVAAGVGQPEMQERRGLATPYFLSWAEDRALDALPVLIATPADVNAVSKAGRTALHGAANTGASRLVGFLVEHGAALNAQDHEGQTPFRLAQGHNSGAASFFSFPETAEVLKTLGADTTLGVDARRSTFGQKVK